MTKKYVTKTLDTDTSFSLTDIAELTNALPPEERETVELAVEEAYYDYDSHPYHRIIISYRRLETDEEYELRVNKDAIEMEERKQKEIKLFKQLQEKYKDIV